MKPAPFKYVAPQTMDEAIAALVEHGYEAKLLAGGQSLIPTMNFRLAQPGVLIDLNCLPDLGYISPTNDNGVRIGAMTRQRQVERSGVVAERVPLLAATMPHIAHVQIRNRGTIGGSLAHADPAAELPAVMAALGGKFLVRGPAGERRIHVDDFYVGLFTTALEPEEMLVEVEIPPQPARSGYAIEEMARRHGDYALVGVAAQVEIGEDTRCVAARLVYFSVGDGPVSAQGASRVLVGERPSRGVIEAAADVAATEDIDPPTDIHASARFRRHLVRVLGKRALVAAFARAGAIVE